MSKSCFLALFLGSALVILAVIVFAAVATPTQETTRQRLHMQQAVVSLEQQCLTCHSAEPTYTHLITYTYPAFPAVAPNTSMPQTPAAQVDVRLHVLGKRLLDLPETAGHATVSESFLRTYELTRTNTTPETLLQTLQDLQTIEQRLIALEHRTYPLTWKDDGHIPSFAAPALQTASQLPLPAVADIQTFQMPNTETEPYLLPADQQVYIPLRMVFAVPHRGPPLNEIVSYTLFRTGRLPSGDAQSLILFTLVGSRTTICA